MIYGEDGARFGPMPSLPRKTNDDMIDLERAIAGVRDLMSSIPGCDGHRSARSSGEPSAPLDLTLTDVAGEPTSVHLATLLDEQARQKVTITPWHLLFARCRIGVAFDHEDPRFGHPSSGPDAASRRSTQ